MPVAGHSKHLTEPSPARPALGHTPLICTNNQLPDHGTFSLQVIQVGQQSKCWYYGTLT